jgi:ABC-2 type transport system permease protein
MAFRFRTIQAAPLMQLPVFLLLFFAPVYVPLDLLTGWIETLATYNPITYMLEAGRSLLAGAPTEVALAFALGVAMIAGFALWAYRGLRRAEAAG